MGMSTAHIFYIPVIFLVGLFAGFFMGRRAAEKEARELRKRRERKEKLRQKKAGESSDVQKASDGA